MAPGGGGGDAPQGDDAALASRGFDDAELATCIKVLRALGTAPRDRDGADAAAIEEKSADAEGSGGGGGGGVHAAFHHKAHKQLRIALQPFLGELRGKLFHGVDPDVYKATRQGKKDRNRRAMRERALDREFVDNSRMRAERLSRLAALEAGHRAASSAPPLSICDGDGDAEEDEEEAARRDGCAARLPLVPDGCAAAESDDRAAAGDAATPSASGGGHGGEPEPHPPPPLGLLNRPRQCYACKRRYRELHAFYASLCPECADLNWTKRRQTADLRGRVCVVTGARVKIGYRIALKLLRCGATVVATTRFPADATSRFEREADHETWRDRLAVCAMDLRDLPGLERLCERFVETLPRLDVIVNNACQTVRRPPAYYAHLLAKEAEAEAGGMSRTTRFLGNERGGGAAYGLLARVADGDGNGDGDDAVSVFPRDVGGWRDGDADVMRGAGWMAPSAAASQLSVLPGDALDASTAAKHFPAGALDVNGQQVDLRMKHSWTMKLGEVETPELLEVLAVNAAAPFVLNGKLRALMARTAAMGRRDVDSDQERAAADGDGGECGGEPADARAFIVNVSAMEGKFYRHKTANHPHTNMAKAALNMMTATAAADYAADRIYMNSVDTGWINDENPLETAARIARDHAFQTPIDEEDAAARCLAPVIEGCVPGSGTPPFGKFFKDYRESEW